jgi:hypothetical protein
MRLYNIKEYTIDLKYIVAVSRVYGDIDDLDSIHYYIEITFRKKGKVNIEGSEKDDMKVERKKLIRAWMKYNGEEHSKK